MSLVAGLLVVLGVVVFSYSRLSTGAPASSSAAHELGNPSAPVTVEEWIDLQ